jgi:hypothetical protein
MMFPESFKTMAENCNTLVAVSILCRRFLIDKKDVLRGLNRNVPCIGGDGFEFQEHHIDQLREYIRDTQSEWYHFAFTLKFYGDARLGRGVQRLRNGCFHDYMFLPKEGVTFNMLVATYESVVDPVRFRKVYLGIGVEVGEPKVDETEIENLLIPLTLKSVDELLADQMATKWNRE